MDIDHPFHIDGRGRTAEADANDHLRDLIEQILFTSPGERVNRPDFGSGVYDLLFEGTSDELVAATQFRIQGALQRWLADRIAVEDVDVQRDEGTLNVTVVYRRLADASRDQVTFVREV